MLMVHECFMDCGRDVFLVEVPFVCCKVCEEVPSTGDFVCCLEQMLLLERRENVKALWVGHR
jgi:hypothetical protein